MRGKQAHARLRLRRSRSLSPGQAAAGVNPAATLRIVLDLVTGDLEVHMLAG
jgi:hypothetical protein